jgi:hypothetical protein
MAEAQNKGTDYVKVSLQNDTNQLIPVQLQRELMDFNTGLNQKWMVLTVVIKKAEPRLRFNSKF